MSKVARIYLRVSTSEQDLERQRHLIDDARNAGYYIAAVYEDKASGINVNRPGLMRLLNELQPGDVIIAEHIDRISRLPIAEARQLVEVIKKKHASIAINGLASLDLSAFLNENDSISKIVCDAIQNLLLEIALEMASLDYKERRRRTTEGIERAKRQGKFKGRPANKAIHRNILELCDTKKYTNKQIANLAGCSQSLVEKVKRARSLNIS